MTRSATRDAPPEPRSQGDEIVARLRHRYHLTRAESAVAVLIADARPLADVARTLGVSIFTVRAHLRSIFAKTGVNRQAALVKLVLQITIARREHEDP